MNSYHFINVIHCTDLGVRRADSVIDALDAVARAAGHAGYIEAYADNAFASGELKIQRVPTGEGASSPVAFGDENDPNGEDRMVLETKIASNAEWVMNVEDRGDVTADDRAEIERRTLQNHSLQRALSFL